MTDQFDSQTFVRRMEAGGMARGVAEELADVLGGSVLDGLVMRRDLHETEMRLDNHLRETELKLRQDIKELGLRVTVRMGAMAGAIIAILGVLIAIK